MTIRSALERLLSLHTRAMCGDDIPELREWLIAIVDAEDALGRQFAPTKVDISELEEKP